MNTHINARTCVYSRGLIIQRHQSGEPQQSIADALGISRRTVCKWIKRWQDEGQEGLHDRISRPERFPNQLAQACIDAIVHLRKTFLMTAFAIARHLGLAYSTVCRYLKRYGLSRKRDIMPQPKIIRYEHKMPGDMIHIDIKKLRQIDGAGHRMHGDRTKGNGKGWEYLHVAIDDCSRIAYCQILADETSDTSIEFAKQAKAFFESHGMSVKRIMTDNGVGYKKQYRRTLKSWNIKHITTKPYTPQTNGKAERFIKTCLNEWAYAYLYHHSSDRKKALQPFLDHYNNARYHHGIKSTPMCRCEQRLDT